MSQLLRPMQQVAARRLTWRADKEACGEAVGRRPPGAAGGRGGAPAAVLALTYYLLVGLVAGWRCREVLTSSPTARAVFGPGRSK